jgi:hypothetical protein
MGGQLACSTLHVAAHVDGDIDCVSWLLGKGDGVALLARLVRNGLRGGTTVSYGPGTSQQHERKRPSVTDWVAILLSIAAVGVALYGVHRTSQVQGQANSIARENVRVAQENITLQEQLQTQNQAAQARAAAQSVVIRTDPAGIFAGTPAQGVVIDNGAKDTIVDVVVAFVNSANVIVAISHIPVINGCNTVQLNWTTYYTPPTNFDAWLYFKDQNGSIWVTDLYGYFSEIKQEPAGFTDVSQELSASSGNVLQGACGK